LWSPDQETRNTDQGVCIFQPHQNATVASFIPVAINISEDKQLCFSLNTVLSDAQVTYGCDFTKTRCHPDGESTDVCQISKIQNGDKPKWLNAIAISKKGNTNVCTYVCKYTVGIGTQ